jgi:hypothetical protein
LLLLVEIVRSRLDGGEFSSVVVVVAVNDGSVSSSLVTLFVVVRSVSEASVVDDDMVVA